ncbi:M14 family zinc carboxypeptidase [Actinotalea sp. M2MS4P-6]|uniref:M14 family zinc carboxypeptidase n=1 Tax=Actinotalea sp. M2MS4P-6 TaxID=2983762 RepID=UPI0021E491FB|nr:M14 family zinc carboxypeptidase [Actinotalea sp. M2MS4P-6]MCV2395323.1 M14 family zinc carboxypeptidase [Actinotalea sp. M2MS4P-6]
MTSTDQRLAGSLEDTLERARRVRPLRDFPTVDELLASFDALAEAHPGLVSRRRIGTSRLDEPIPMYVVGSGPRHHLLFAGVHPNEPIGFRTLQHLAEQLCTDPELRATHDATWYLVPCIDPDGTRLNEGWYAEPADRVHYARGFYRPAPDEQVEWTFPFAWKGLWFDRVLPETQALMRVIDEVRPRLMVSLHNAELGGVYYYVSEALPGLVDALHAVPESLGLPLETGEPESPSLTRLAPAVFRATSLADDLEFVEGLGVDPGPLLCGDSSAAYAARYGTFSLIAELPYWSHPAVGDQSPTAATYRDTLLAKADALAGTGRLLGAILDAARPGLSVATPFRRASEAFIPVLSRMAEQERARAARPENDRPATVAEVFDNEDLVRCFRLRYGGMLLRALDAEVDAGVAPAEVRAQRARMLEVWREWTTEARALEDLTTLPVAALVGVQLGAVLAAAHAVAERDRQAADGGEAAR